MQSDTQPRLTHVATSCKTHYPQASLKLFQEVITNLQMASCNKLGNLTDLLQLDQIQKFVTTCSQVVVATSR